MLDQTLTLPEDREELRSFTGRILAEVKAQAILIEKLHHQLAGHRPHRFGASSETPSPAPRVTGTPRSMNSYHDAGTYSGQAGRLCRDSLYFDLLSLT